MAPRHLVPLCLLVFSFHSQAQQNLSAWAEKIQVKGDIRVRHDYNSQEDADDTSERHRERLRLRLGFYTQVNDQTKVNVRLSTAEGADPISTNQSMTGNSDKKSVYFDLANIDWAWSEKNNILLGKMENPMRVLSQSQLIYDVDYTPEGFASTNKFGGFFVNAGAFSIQERAPQSTSSGTSEPDSGLLAGVIGYKSEGESMSWLVAGGYHTFTNLKKNSALTSRFAGNSSVGGTGAAGRYIHDYQVAELGAEVKFKLSGSALTVFTDAIQNLYIEEDNVGLLAGVQFQTLGEDGKAKWTVAYAYQALDKDATVSAVNNSDWGNGNDGGFGHLGQIGYNFNSNTAATLTWMHMNVDNNGVPFGTERALADLVVSF
jgi:hypothetical protein